MSAKTARRIAIEYALCAGFWTLVTIAFAMIGHVDWLLVGYVIPAMISGIMQTTRKYIEHMGLYGDTVDSSTRTVHDDTIFGRILSFSILSADIHGPHHVHAKIPQSHLSEALDLLQEEGVLTSNSIYPNYWSATKALLREIRDPRIGRQWIDRSSQHRRNPTPLAS